MRYVRPVAKAVLGFLAPGAVVIGGAVSAESTGGAAITSGEWVTALTAMIITGAAVYSVPNSSPEDGA